MKTRMYQSPLKNKLIHKIIETAGDAVISFDHHGQIVLWNETATELFGYPQKEAIGQAIESLILNDQQRAFFLSKLEELKADDGGSPKNTFELQAISQTGAEMTVEVTLSAFYVDGQRYFTALLRDVSLRKKAEVRKVQSQQLEALRRLASKVADDFNNVLTVIRGYVELMRHQKSEHDLFFKQIEAILKATEHAEHLTKQLLTFGQESSGTGQNVNIAKVYASLKVLVQKILEPDIKLQEEIEPDLWQVHGESEKLKQIFLNLFLNAREAMPEGGLVQLKIQNVFLSDAEKSERGLTVENNNFLMLQVADNGKGIPEEVQKKIFEPFFTTDAEEKKSGLGLSIVYGIVKSMNGVIICESQPGQGTTFSIYLPANKVSEETIEGKEVQVEGGKETILVVEDVPEVQLLLVELLQTVGYKTIGKSNYQEAMEYYQAHAGEIDMIISDVVLPDYYGTELIRNILGEKPDLKYILISGYAEQLDIEQNKSLFHGHFLQKPFQPARLLQMVRNMLDKGRAD